jgi:hypothetical protein
VQRTVTRGDGFKKIANALGIHPWTLVHYNFPTVGTTPSQKGAREVNWYLQEYLGCAEVTHNRKNYIFHEGMKRSYIYVPVQTSDFAGSLIEATLPSDAWFGFGLKTTQAVQPLIQVEVKEDHAGALFSWDHFSDWFELSISGKRYGLGVSPLQGSGGLVAYIATGVKLPKQLNGHEIDGVDFSLQLGPLSKALKSAKTAWKLKGVAGGLAKVGLTLVEWEKSRDVFKQVMTNLDIDPKSPVPKLHIIDLPIGVGLEASLYYLVATAKVQFVHIEHGRKITTTMEDIEVP